MRTHSEYIRKSGKMAITNPVPTSLGPMSDKIVRSLPHQSVCRPMYPQANKNQPYEEDCDLHKPTTKLRSQPNKPGLAPTAR